MSKLNLKTGRLASGVPSKIDLSATIQSDKPRLNLDTALKAAVTLNLDTENYVLEGLDLDAKGTAAGFTDLVASARAASTPGSQAGKS